MQKKSVHIGMAVGCVLLLLVGSLRLWVPRPLFNDPCSTLLYATVDSSDVLLGARIAADGQWRFPEAAEVPEKFACCIQQYEDKRFRQHPGVDVAALLRAAWWNLREGRVVSGGSTLTMQVARMARKNPPRTVGQKFVELVLLGCGLQ